MANSTSRPSSSTTSRARETSRRASARSWRSATLPSAAHDVPASSRLGATVTKWSDPVSGDMMRRALASFRTRRLILAALAAALIALMVLAPGVLADAITPESGGGSKNAESIDTLYKIALYVAIVIFLIVEGTLLWSIFRYRARRGGPEPAQIRGNTPLELGWTIAAAMILVVLATVTFVYLARIENPPPSDPGGLQSLASEQAAVGQAPIPGG